MESLSETITSFANDRDPTRRAPPPPPAGHFGVYDEGDGLLSLYATPLRPGHLAAAIEALDPGGVLLDLTPCWGLPAGVPVSEASLANREGPTELLHAPDRASVDLDPRTLMAAPHEALPADSGRRFAVSLHDDHHGVIYTREREVLAAFLAAWLDRRVSATAPDDTSCPPILAPTLDSVLEVVPPQAWRHLVLDARRRFWSLDVSALVADGTGGHEVIEALTWVGGPRRAWRAGWSW